MPMLYTLALLGPASPLPGGRIAASPAIVMTAPLAIRMPFWPALSDVRVNTTIGHNYPRFGPDALAQQIRLSVALDSG